MDSIVTSLFVYGTLRARLNHEAFIYIADSFELAGLAKTRGFLFDLGDYPAAVATSEEVFITGELYNLKEGADFEHAIKEPDEYEGANPLPGEPQSFRRELTEVWCRGEKKAAWIYWFEGSTEGCQRIESGDIMNYRNQKIARWM